MGSLAEGTKAAERNESVLSKRKERRVVQKEKRGRNKSDSRAKLLDDLSRQRVSRSERSLASSPRIPVREVGVRRRTTELPDLRELLRIRVPLDDGLVFEHLGDHASEK